MIIHLEQVDMIPADRWQVLAFNGLLRPELLLLLLLLLLLFIIIISYGKYTKTFQEKCTNLSRYYVIWSLCHFQS